MKTITKIGIAVLLSWSIGLLVGLSIAPKESTRIVVPELIPTPEPVK